MLIKFLNLTECVSRQQAAWLQTWCGQTQSSTTLASKKRNGLTIKKDVAPIFLEVKQLITSLKRTTCCVLYELTKCKWMDTNYISGMELKNFLQLLLYFLPLIIVMCTTTKQRFWNLKTIQSKSSSIITHNILLFFQTSWMYSLGAYLSFLRKFLKFCIKSLLLLAPRWELKNQKLTKQALKILPSQQEALGHQRAVSILIFHCCVVNPNSLKCKVNFLGKCMKM